MDKQTDWTDFFKVNGEYAQRNLSIFMGMTVGSVVVLGMAMGGALTTEIFAIYMAASGGIYFFGKWQDDKTERSRIDAAAPPQNVTNNTINQPEIANVATK